MKFLANENFPLSSVRSLQDLGYEITAIIEESPGVSDVEVLTRASCENLIILTFDRDYGDLIYRQGLPNPRGLIYFRFQPKTPIEPTEILVELLQVKEVSVEGQFTVIDRDRIRQRRLP